MTFCFQGIQKALSCQKCSTFFSVPNKNCIIPEKEQKMRDKLNALRLVNLMEDEVSKLENAVKEKDTAKIRERKNNLLTFQKELQTELER